MFTWLKPPILLLAFSALLAISLSFRFEKVQRADVINSDAYGYYAYLPAVFVHASPDFSFYPALDYESKQRYWISEGMEGKYLPKTSMGLAYLWTPGFLIAHASSKVFGYESDGWSIPYQLAVLLTSVLFLVIGLYCVWLWLRQWVSSVLASLTVFLLVGATNLLHYSGPQASFSHVYSFSLIAFGLWLTSRWLENPRARYFAMLGVVFGLITLIRPTNGIFALIPILLAVFQGKWRSHLLQPAALIGILCFLLPWIPQFIFWKEVTGSWIYYSYGEEQIFWLKPHILDGLLSFRNGWLIYTPIMVLALLGIIPLWRWNRPWAIVMLLFTVAHIYITFSWWCWYYGDSLSIRPMVDMYALLALPLALLLRRLATFSFATWPAFLLLFALLFWNNLLQTDQYSRGYINGSMMTRQAFQALLFNTNPPSHLSIIGAYQIADNDRLRLGMPEREQRDTIIEKQLLHVSFDETDDVSGKAGNALQLIGHKNFSEEYTVSAAEFETPFDRILRTSAWVKSEDFEKLEAYLVLSFEDGDKVYGYCTVEIHSLNLKDDEWNRVNLFIRKPSDLPDSGHVKTYFWLKKGKALSIDELKLELLDCPYSEPLIPSESDS